MNNATPTSKRLVIRSNAQGTVNRSMLRRLIAEGRIEARVDFSYDDMSGSSRGDTWLPARLSTGYGDSIEGSANITVDDLESDCGRAYITETGKLWLRIHSNLIWELRVKA